MPAIIGIPVHKFAGMARSFYEPIIVKLVFCLVLHLIQSGCGVKRPPSIS